MIVKVAETVGVLELHFLQPTHGQIWSEEAALFQSFWPLWPSQWVQDLQQSEPNFWHKHAQCEHQPVSQDRVS